MRRQYDAILYTFSQRAASGLTSGYRRTIMRSDGRRGNRRIFPLSLHCARRPFRPPARQSSMSSTRSSVLPVIWSARTRSSEKETGYRFPGDRQPADRFSTTSRNFLQQAALREDRRNCGPVGKIYSDKIILQNRGFNTLSYFNYKFWHDSCIS